jgi:hypothetical protein
MESSTFRKWLVEHGCRIDHGEHHQRHEGQVMVTVHREGRKTEVPLGGSHQVIDARGAPGFEELGLQTLPDFEKSLGESVDQIDRRGRETE